jgi:hypothetical protein
MTSRLSVLLVLAATITISHAAWIENDSYKTLCAEMDNVNIPVWAEGASAYRVVAANPRYHPTTISEWGADWEDCSFSSDRNLWIIGNADGQYLEFQTNGFPNGDIYYAPDNPAAGTDEPFWQMPREINNDWMYDQYIKFTADEDNDVNIEVRIGAVLTVRMVAISGTLEIEARALTTNGWLNLGRQVFNSSNLLRTWNIPDHTWMEGTDTNVIHLHVVRASEGGQSTPGAWAYYDYLQLRRRDERGDNSSYPAVLYADSNTIVEAVWIDFWWRNPREMRIVVLGGSTIETSQYLRIKRRMPNSSDWNEVFVLYEDGNARIIPYPPEGIGAVPYGASVILGPTTNGPRPACGINEVIVDPTNLTLHLTYEIGGSADVALRAHRDGHYVDVYNIRYDTTNNSLVRFRSMWVHDGKSDIDHIACAQGTLPILEHWSYLNGTWWQFVKNVASYHNTYCPEFFMELIGPDIGFLHREAEHYNSQTGGSVQSARTNAYGSQTLRFENSGGDAVYNISLTSAQPDVYMHLRYSDASAGNGIDTWGNRVRVVVDNSRTAEVYSVRTKDWNDFRLMPRIALGDFAAGNHEIKLLVDGGTDGIELDAFTLVSQRVPTWTPKSIVTRQGESYSWQTNATFAYRGNAVGGASMHLEHSGAPPALGFWVNIPTDYHHAYMRIRYADDVGPNQVRVYVNNELRGKFPTLDTGWWNDFINSPPLYLGSLAAGTNLITIAASLETWGVDIDQFELYAYDNAPPTIQTPSQIILPVMAATSLVVSVNDADGDTVTLTNPIRPTGAVFAAGALTWTAQVERCGTTNLAVFVADDGRNITNSISTNVVFIIVPHDWDEDMLPDDWEWTQFSSYAYTGADDPDDDGAPNAHELIAGTAPMNPNDVFAASAPSGIVQRVVAVPTKPGRRYTIYYADTLPSSPTGRLPFTGSLMTSRPRRPAARPWTGAATTASKSRSRKIEKVFVRQPARRASGFPMFGKRLCHSSNDWKSPSRFGVFPAPLSIGRARRPRRAAGLLLIAAQPEASPYRRLRPAAASL